MTGQAYIGYAQDYLMAVEMMFPPLPKLWIAEADDTYYDSGGHWVVGVFESLEGAKAFCDAEFKGPKTEWHYSSTLNTHDRTYTVVNKYRDVDPTVTISQIVVRP